MEITIKWTKCDFLSDHNNYYPPPPLPLFCVSVGCRGRAHLGLLAFYSNDLPINQDEQASERVDACLCWLPTGRGRRGRRVIKSKVGCSPMGRCCLLAHGRRLRSSAWFARQPRRMHHNNPQVGEPIETSRPVAPSGPQWDTRANVDRRAGVTHGPCPVWPVLRRVLLRASGSLETKSLSNCESCAKSQD